MMDVKKLVTGFLVLAVATSASALLISGIGASSTVNDTAIVAGANDGANPAQPAAPAPDNAFLPQQTAQNSVTLYTDDNTDPTLASSTDPTANDPNNLTNVLANTYLNNLMVTNPNGPQDDGTGNPSLTPPDTNSVIAQFEGSSTPGNVQIPNWDTEVGEIAINIVSSSPSALASYGSAVQSIINQNIDQSNLQSMLNGNSDPSAGSFVAGKVTTALKDISGLETPEPAVAFQKSLIKMFVYAKNSLLLVQNAGVDPVKTALIFQAEDAKYQLALQDLKNQTQKMQSEKLFSDAKPGSGDSVMNSVLAFVGIPTAHAQFAAVVSDPATEAGVWGTIAQMIEAYAKDIILQIIKNALVFIMQKTIIAGIQGSGAPAFVQQWAKTLANSFTQTALGALNSQMVCVGNAPFAPQLRLTLGATYKPGNNNVCAAQFNSQLGNNLTKYYNNFSNGGWLTFSETMKPDNDYYGSMYFTAQAVGFTAQNGQTAAQSKAVAAQGFHGSATCDDGSSPNGYSAVCSQGDPSSAAGQQEETVPGTSCPSGWTLVQTIPNEGSCSDGSEPLVQTPGTIFNNMVNSAVDGNFKLITSANSWAGLASGLFISILQQTLNSLAQTTIAGANGLLQQAASNGGSGTNGGAASAAVPLQCSAQPGSTANTFTFSAIGGQTVSATGATTPQYNWSGGGNPATAVNTGIFTTTFNASGTYQVTVNDIVDKSTATCVATVP